MAEKLRFICSGENVNVIKSELAHEDITGLWVITVACSHRQCPAPLQTFRESGFDEQEAKNVAKNRACRSCPLYR